jgi:uncharacterized protein YfkK (UPF0435 family)
MKSKSEAYVNQPAEELEQQLKLSNEEITYIESLRNLSGEQLDDLRDFIFTISTVLYKTCNNAIA